MCEYCGCQAVTAALANLNPDDWDAIDTIRAAVGTLLPAPGR